MVFKAMMNNINLAKKWSDKLRGNGNKGKQLWSQTTCKREWHWGLTAVMIYLAKKWSVKTRPGGPAPTPMTNH